MIIPVNEKLIKSIVLGNGLISEKEKDNVFDDLLTSFLKSSQAYLSHSDFPIRYASREYLKKKQQSSWNTEGNSE